MAHSIQTIEVNQRVVIDGREDLGAGQVLRIQEVGGTQQADVLFESGGERHLETIEVNRLRPSLDPWERLAVAETSTAPGIRRGSPWWGGGSKLMRSFSTTNGRFCTCV